MAPCRPQAVAFDVVETFISLEPLRRRFVEIGLHASALERWYDGMLRDGMALTLVGDYAPFPKHYAEIFAPVDVTGVDLTEVATRLVVLPEFRP
jgi:hypothetical protein